MRRKAMLQILKLPHKQLSRASGRTLSYALNTPGHGRATSRARLQCKNLWRWVLLQRLLYLRPAGPPARIGYGRVAHEARNSYEGGWNTLCMPMPA